MSTLIMDEPASAHRVGARVVLASQDDDPPVVAPEASRHAPGIRTSNRRSHQRLSPQDFRWLRAARLKYGAEVDVIDISAGGMLIEIETELQRGSKMVFELAGPDNTLLVACRVLRCDRVEHAGGVRYRAACAFSRPLELPALVGDTQLTASVAGDIVAGLDALGRTRDDARAERTTTVESGLSGVAWQKVIVRYRDGQLLRGYTNNFHADRPQLHLSEQPCSGSTVMVPLSRLKALFFVREFTGDPHHVDRHDFHRGYAGRKVEITFHDGEVLVGSTISYRCEGNGFFVQPADAKSNNIRVFVILGAIQHLRFL